MTKFIPNSLLEFITERIRFCDACIPGLKALSLSKNSAQINQHLDKFKKTHAELNLAKNWILNGDDFDKKGGYHMAKTFLNDCLFHEQMILHGSRSFFTSAQIKDTVNYIEALRHIAEQ